MPALKVTEDVLVGELETRLMRTMILIVVAAMTLLCSLAAGATALKNPGMQMLGTENYAGARAFSSRVSSKIRRTPQRRPAWLH